MSCKKAGETGEKKIIRNQSVENAVLKAIARIDDFIGGERLELPSPTHRRACEDLLASATQEQKKGRKRGSRRTAALFFSFYRIEEPAWNFDSLPTGVRGKYGDKFLCENLSLRNITLHDTITAFAENLGWKSNIKAGNVHLQADDRFSGFLKTISGADASEQQLVANYMAQQFAASRVEIQPLPPVGTDVLTFVRAKVLFYQLIDLPSEGHIQQFFIAALLSIYRRRTSVEVRTHHPHAADKYDGTAGDIEEWRDGELLRAYEVTVRDDWKNRISNFKEKMDRFSLHKYLIIAKGINDDPHWSEPANLALNFEPYGRDIAVVDIRDLINFLAAELSPEELRQAVNRGYDLLSDRKLSGREEFRVEYREAVRDWLDTIEAKVYEG